MIYKCNPRSPHCSTIETLDQSNRNFSRCDHATISFSQWKRRIGVFDETNISRALCLAVERYMIVFNLFQKLPSRYKVKVTIWHKGIYNCGGCWGGVAFNPNKLPDTLLEERLFLWKLLLAEEELTDGDWLPGIDCGNT